MAIWYKQGVCGKLQPTAADGLRKIDRLYASRKQDVFVTSVQDGSHSPGSFHTVGLAWDMRKGRVSKSTVQKILGPDFDVVDEYSHRHVEFDPPTQ